MKEVIIYGVGEEAEEAYETLMLFPEYEILFFVDRNVEKQGKKCCGHEVLSPDVLKDSKWHDSRIVVTTRGSYIEIVHFLEELGYTDIIGLGGREWNNRRERMRVYDLLNHKRCIDFGRFFMDNCGEIVLQEMPFIYGGSGILDYVFLQILAKKYQCKTYLEIGTYIGTSINLMSFICNQCYGITAPLGASYSMRNWCREKNMPDYSSALVNKKNIQMYYSDSRLFDYSQITDDIDLFFIDGDHSYNGVYCDTKNVFNIRKPDSIIVWHDFSQLSGGDDAVLAVRDALGEEFENVFVTDNNICGIYIPKHLQEDFPRTEKYFHEGDRLQLYLYDVSMKVHQ